jgi:flagellar motor switch protein FliM
MSTEVAEPQIETPAPTAVARTETADASQRFQFSNASALSPARQQSLESWHRNFLRSASTSVGDFLRLNLGLELVSVKIQTYGDVVKERSEESHSVLFRMNPQPGIWLLDLPVSLSLQLVDRMMGGSGILPELPEGAAPKELTELDQTIFQQFAETFLADYARSWKPHANLQAEVLRQVRNLNYQLIHQPDALILRVGIEVTVQESKSIMWLIVPIVSVEDLLHRSLAADARVKQEDAQIKDKKASPMGSVPVPISVRWQGFQLTLREVEAMAVGDVLVLDNKKCDTVAVWLGDKAKFAGRVVREPQKTTVTITGPVE